MDKLLYKAESYLIALRMGVDEKKIEEINNYQKGLRNNILEFHENENYTKRELSPDETKLHLLADKLKDSLEKLEDYNGDYNLSNFLSKLNDYKNFKTIFEKKEKVAKEVDGVINMFGEFSENKSSEDLTMERNTRLAMLNQMHADGKITDEELKKNVIYLRRVYQRSIENQVTFETQKHAEQLRKDNTITGKIKNKINKMVSKIANVFKINVKNNNHVEINKNEENAIIDRNACQALGKVSDMLTTPENANKPEILAEVSELDNTNLEIIKTNQFSNKISLIEIASEIYKPNILNAKDKEMQDYYMNEVFNFGNILVSKDNGKIKINNNLKSERTKFSDYMYKKYATKFEMMGSVPIEKFEDEKIQKLYDDVMKQFDNNILKVNVLKKCENVVKDKVTDLEHEMNI